MIRRPLIREPFETVLHEPFDPRFALIVTLIRNDLRGVPRAAKLSNLVNMSTSRFYELFKAETGVCPACYTKTERMRAASRLLETSLQSVKQIAAEVGFTDQSHFVRDFKKKYGLAPTEYRKRNFCVEFQESRNTH